MTSDIARLRPKLIGITGGKGTGKDTVALHLVEMYGFVRISFADPIKKALAAMFDAPISVFDDPAVKEMPLAILGGNSPRRLMQTLGTEWGRDIISSTLWSDLALCKIDAAFLRGDRHIVVPDVRFDSEVVALRTRNAVVWRITRDEAVYGKGDTHRSEGGVSPTFIDATIRNNTDKRMLFTQVGVAFSHVDQQASRSNNGTAL